MRRREFITLLGGVAAAWPLTSRAQQAERMRRVGVLMASEETDTRPKVWLSQFTQGLTELGWVNGRNLLMDVRWAGNDVDRMRMFAKQFVNQQPRRDPRIRNSGDRCVAARDADNPDRLCDRLRSRR